ncbi:MAG: YvcK family protein, partial [Dehalococcoidia bacterium]|nr:YvcK family protein [Dehalococcoidia bacterium]
MPPSSAPTDVFDAVYRNRTRGRGPKIVAIGGGTGLSNLLRGLKEYTANLTAIVTVADDGGSSGKLRQNLKVIPPGDIRNCIASLAEAEPLVTELFQYRFDERAGDGLAGHSFGNLFIT